MNFALLSSVSFLASLAAAQTACNNAAALCSRSYANITHLGAHDSPFVANSSNRFTISGNQFYDSITQLDTGVRLLTAQVHRVNDSSTANPTLRLCHTDCGLLDAGTLVNWLSGIKSWLDRNPNDVVTILLVNSVNADAATLGADFTAANIANYGYVPSSSARPIQASSWPTLQSMISSNKRLVTFIDSVTDNSAAPYLLDEFSNVFENPYLVLNTSGHTCNPDRPTSLRNNAQQATQSGRLFLMNHFLDRQELYFQIPDVNASASTNSPDVNLQGSLGQHAAQCTTQYGKAPNFVLVDWASVGPAIAGVDALNGVTGAVSGRVSVDQGILSMTNTTAVSTSPGSGTSSSSGTGTGTTTASRSPSATATTTTGAAARVSSQVSGSLAGLLAVFFAALML